MDEYTLDLKSVSFTIQDKNDHLCVSVIGDDKRIWHLPKTIRSTDVQTDCLCALLFAICANTKSIDITGFNTTDTQLRQRISADSSCLSICFVESDKSKEFLEYLNVKSGANVIVSATDEACAFIDPAHAHEIAQLTRNVVMDWCIFTGLRGDKIRTYHFTIPSTVKIGI